jgi:hypothetical protein
MIPLKSLLPSKRFFLAVLGILVGGVVVLVLVRIMDRTQQKEIIPTTTNTLLNQEVADRIDDISVTDTDNDGLMDWEESLWGTDPMMADTDNDGISDKEQIAERRAQLEKNVADNGTAIDEPLTTTDVLARDLYTTVSVLSQNGTLDDNRDTILNSIASSIDTIKLYQPVSLADMKLVPTNRDTVVAYVVAVGDLMSQYPFIQEEFVNLAQGASAGATDDMLALQEKYKSFSSALEDVSTPTDVQNQHGMLINALRYVNGVIYALIHAVDDPAIGMAGVRNFLPMLDGVSATYDAWYQEVVGDVFTRFTP